MATPRLVLKCPKNNQNWRLIHAFGLPGVRVSNVAGCLLGTWEVIWKESCRLERICGCLYVHFETISCFTRIKRTNGCSEAFRENANGVKHPCNVTSHVGTPKNVLGENMAWSGEVQKCRKNNPNWRLIHAFGLSGGPSSERHGMPPRDIGGHWKAVTWLGMNMWMPLHSFLDNFWFHEKWTNGVLRGFSKQCKLCRAPAQSYKLRRHS